MHLLEDILAVVSLDKLCEEHGYTYEWTSGHKPHLTKNGKKILNITGNYVPLVVTWTVEFQHELLLAIAFARLFLTSSKCANCGNLQRGSCWKQRRVSSENLENVEMPAAANNSQESDSERPTKVVSKSRKYSFFSITKRPKLRGLQSNQDYEDSSQKTHYRSGTSSRKVGWNMQCGIHNGRTIIIIVGRVGGQVGISSVLPL